jgi:hypothetical protein
MYKIWTFCIVAPCYFVDVCVQIKVRQTSSEISQLRIMFVFKNWPKIPVTEMMSD